MKGQPFFARYARWILACFALATPLIIYSAFQTVRSNTNKVEDWLPATFAETHDLAWFRKLFVADQFVLISWEGCRLGGDPADPGADSDDPRIERLAQMLVPTEIVEPQSEAVGSHPRYFGSVTTGRRVLEQLTAPPMNVPYALAVERLKGSLIGPDGRQTCLLVTLSDEELASLRKAIGRGSARRSVRSPMPGNRRYSAPSRRQFACSRCTRANWNRYENSACTADRTAWSSKARDAPGGNRLHWREARPNAHGRQRVGSTGALDFAKHGCWRKRAAGRAVCAGGMESADLLR